MQKMELKRGPRGKVELENWGIGIVDEQSLSLGERGTLRRLSGSEGSALGYCGE